MADRAEELGLVDYDLTSAKNHACARRELNAELAVRAYDAGRNLALHRPVDVFLQVASACNLDCYMCAEHNRPEQWRHGRGLKSLPPELFEKIESEIFPYAKRLTIGVGGEPMISRHFLDYLERAHAAGLEVHVMSNGTQINNDKKAEALARCTVSMEISVDGATPETYERIRRGSKWMTLVKNLQRLNRFRDQMPPEERTHLTLCYVLMKSNVHEFPLFVDFGKAIGADRVSGWHVIPLTAEGHEETLQEDRARSNAYCEAARKRGEELGIEVDVPEPFPLAAGESQPDVELPELDDQVPFHIAASLVPPTIEGDPEGEPDEAEAFAYADEEEDAAPPEDLTNTAAPPIAPDPVAASNGHTGNGEAAEVTGSELTDEERRKEAAPKKGGVVREAARHAAPDQGRIHCSSPSTAVFLFYDGRVLPCCHPHSHNALPMGNLHEQSFAEIWNNDLYRNLRGGLHTGDAPPLCQNCSIVHSPPPQVERFDDLVGEEKNLAKWYEGKVPDGDVTSERAFVIDALTEPWYKLYEAIEGLATDRKELRDGYQKLKDELGEEIEAHKGVEQELRVEGEALLRTVREHEDQLMAYQQHVKDLEHVLRRTNGHRIYKWVKRFDRLLGRKDA